MHIDIGLILGIIIAGALWLPPIAIVRKYDFKIRNPKPVFVEPRLLYMVPLILFSWVVTFLVIEFIVALTPFSEYINNQIDHNTFVGNLIESVIIFSSVFVPLCVYMIWITVRYQRIVEYGTREWIQRRRE